MSITPRDLKVKTYEKRHSALEESKSQEKKGFGKWFAEWISFSSWFVGGVKESKQGYEQREGGPVVQSPQPLINGREIMEVEKVEFEIIEDRGRSLEEQYKEAVLYVDERRKGIEKDIIEIEGKIFEETWERMFNKINEDILSGKSYDEVFHEYGKEWTNNFRIEFGEVFGYARKKLSDSEIQNLKVYQKTSEFSKKISELRAQGFYQEFKLLFAVRWDSEGFEDKNLRDSIRIIDDKKRTENAQLVEKMMLLLGEDNGLKVKLDDGLKKRYEKILSEAKIQSYSEEEIEVARIVVSKFLEAFKEHFDGQVDMTAWRVLVSREPMLAKAEQLLFQKQYDGLQIEFKRRELLKKKDEGTLTSEELVKLNDLNYLGEMTSTFSLFFKTLLPWNVVENPASLREEGDLVKVNVIPVNEMGEVLAWVARSVGGENIGEVVTDYAKKIDRGLMEMNAEMTESLENIREQRQWNFDKNRYLVTDFTTQAKGGWVSQGIKGLLKTVIDEPEKLKSKKWLPWLAKYGKASVAGAGTALMWNVLSGGVPTVMTVVGGAVGGSLIERYKGELKTAMAFALPGATAAIGAVVGVAGVAALASPGGLVVIGLAAVLFAIFGVWVVYHTKIGEKIAKKIAKFVYSNELAWFKQWDEKIKRAELGRSVFKQAAEIADRRSGQMYLRTEIGRDQRYQNLEQVCLEFGLSDGVRDAFLEQVRRRPRVLSEPDEFFSLIELMRPEVKNLLGADKIEEIVEKYRQRSHDILKVGLEKRYENLKTELKGLDLRLFEIIGELESGEDALKYDDKLKKVLIDKGISQEAIDAVFDEVNLIYPGKRSIEEANRVKQAVYLLAEGVGARVGAWTSYLASFSPLGRGAEAVGEAEQAAIEEKKAKDLAVVRVALVLREVVKQKDTLADEGALKILLKDVGFEEDLVNVLYDSYDEQSLMAQKDDARAKMISERRIISNLSSDAILAFDIITEAQQNGALKSDEDLLSDEEIAAIRELYADDDDVLALLEMDKDIDIPSKIPDDRLMMYRAGVVRVDHTGRILGLEELDKKARDLFEEYKEKYMNNFDKLRIGLKREKLVRISMNEMIEIKKNAYLDQALAVMGESERMERIGRRSLELLEEYKVFVG